MRKMDEEFPVIKYEKVGFSESRYANGGEEWMASTLLKKVKDDGIMRFKCPIASLDLSGMPIHIETLDCVAYHMRRVLDCSLEYPIIISPIGSVIDGNHRILKALIEGKSWVWAYRMEDMPEPDFVNEEQND